MRVASVIFLSLAVFFGAVSYGVAKDARRAPGSYRVRDARERLRLLENTGYRAPSSYAISSETDRILDSIGSPGSPSQAYLERERVREEAASKRYKLFREQVREQATRLQEQLMQVESAHDQDVRRWKLYRAVYRSSWMAAVAFFLLATIFLFLSVRNKPTIADCPE